MSSVVISGDTSGSVTLSAPAVAGSTTLTLPSTSGTVVTTNTMPAGSVVQVVSTTKTDTFTTTSSSFVDVTGLSVSITPSSASNKILVLVQVNGSQDVAVNRVSLKLLRGATEIANGDAAGSRVRAIGGFYSGDADQPSPTVNVNYLDSPATTSSTTYKIQVAIVAGAGTAFINRTDNDTDSSGYPRTASTITVMEIKA